MTEQLLLTFTTRPYEIVVDDVPGGYQWHIEVMNENIAGSNILYTFPREAQQAAKAWAWLHEQLGYEMRKDWWT